MADPTITFRITGESGDLVGEIKVAQSAFDGLGRAGRRGGKAAEAGMDQAVGGAKRLDAQLDRTTKSVTRNFSAARRGVNSISTSLNRMQNLAVAWAALAGARAAVASVIRTADAMTGLNARLKLVTNSTEAYIQAQEDVVDIATSARASLDSVGKLYVRLSQAAEGLGLEQQRVRNITEAVSLAVTLSGGSAESAAAGVNQLAQSLASGRLSGDEFRSVMENTPRVVQAFTDSLNVNIGTLRKLADQQLLTADIVAEALELQLAKMREEINAFPTTVGQAMQQVRNSWSLYVADVNNASGMTSEMAEALHGISQMLLEAGESAGTLGGMLRGFGIVLKLVVISAVGVKTAVQDLTYIFGFFVEAIGAVIDASKSTVFSFMAVQEAARGNFAAAGEYITKSAGAAATSWEDARRRISAAYQTMNDMAAEGDAELAKAWDMLNGRYVSAAEKADRLTKAAQTINQLAASTNPLVAALAGNLKEATAGWMDYSTAVESTETRQDALQKRIQELLKRLHNVPDEADKAAKAINDYIAKMEQANALRGLEGPDLERAKLAAMPGITPEQLTRGTAAIDRGAELEAQAAAADRAAQAMQSLAAMSARQNDQIIDMRAALAGASQAQIAFNRTQRDAAKELAKVGGMMNPAAVAAYAAAMASAAQKMKLSEQLDLGDEKPLDFANLMDQFSQAKSPFTRLIEEAQDLKEAMRDATSVEEWNQLAKALARTESQIDAIGGATGAAANAAAQTLRSMQTMAEEGSREYEAMGLAIQAMNIVQGIAAILNQGMGDPYTAIPRMAAMAAMVAQMVDGISAFGSSGFSDTAAQRQKVQGTGTVLGDAEAQSESIVNATELTASATEKLVAINTGMLRALQTLQQSIGNASGMIVRGAADADFSGMDLSVENDQNLFEKLDLIGSLIGGSSKVTDQGIIIFAGALGDLLENISLGAYQEVESRTWAFGHTHTKEGVQAITGALETQFQMILDSIATTVREGALALGLDMDAINSAIEQFQIAETRISLQGLSAEDKQAALEAVFSSIFDGLAGAVVPFIGQFQQVGEGLGETLVRVATDVQVMQEAVRQLGLTLDVTDPERFAQISVGLIDLVGGVEEFIQKMTSFRDTFAPESFAFATAVDTINMAFGQAGLTVPATRDAMWELMQSLDASTVAGQEQIATLLRLADVADQYYDMLEARAKAQFDYAALSAGLQAESGQNPLAASLLEVAKWSADTTKKLHELAAAAGMAGAKESDLALVHTIAAARAQAAIDALYESSRALVDQLYGTNDAAYSAGSAVSSFGSAMTTAAQQARDSIDLLLGNLSPFNDRKKLQLALQGQAAGTVTPEQVLQIGRRLFASGADYAQLFQQVMAVGDRTQRGAGGAGSAGYGGQAAREIAEKTLSKAERYQLADRLANNVADLAYAQDIGFSDVAEKLGLDLSDLGRDLGLGNEALQDYLSVLASDNFGLMDLKGVLAGEVDRLIAAITGQPIPTDLGAIDMSGAQTATIDPADVPQAPGPSSAFHPNVVHASVQPGGQYMPADPALLDRLSALEERVGTALDAIGKGQGRYLPLIAESTGATAESSEKLERVQRELAANRIQPTRNGQPLAMPDV